MGLNKVKWLIFSVFIGVLVSIKLNAAEDNYQFDDQNSRQTFLRLTETLRCPKCQNQNIADSDAMIAHDMRRKVYQLVSDGKSEQEVIAFMKQRYGDFVYYRPPVTPITSILWLMPVLFIVIGGVAFVLLKRRSRIDENREDNKHSKLEKANNLLGKD